MNKQELDLAQALRKSHCARYGEGHECVGTCKITPEGVELDCNVCGADKLNTLFNPERVDYAKSILTAAGLTWECLSAEVQVRVIGIVSRAVCPGCGYAHNKHGSGFSCERCGKWWFSAGYGREAGRWMKNEAPKV